MILQGNFTFFLFVCKWFQSSMIKYLTISHMKTRGTACIDVKRSFPIVKVIDSDI